MQRLSHDPFIHYTNCDTDWLHACVSCGDVVQDAIKRQIGRVFLRNIPIKSQTTPQRDHSSPPGRRSTTASVSSSNSEESVSNLLEGRSLLLFGPTNPLRMFLARIVWHPRFEQFIITLIICSSMVLAIDSPSVDPDSTLKIVLVRPCLFDACARYATRTRAPCVVYLGDFPTPARSPSPGTTG
jgi:hypothetical protein